MKDLYDLVNSPTHTELEVDHTHEGLSPCKYGGDLPYDYFMTNAEYKEWADKLRKKGEARVERGKRRAAKARRVRMYRSAVLRIPLFCTSCGENYLPQTWRDASKSRKCPNCKDKPRLKNHCRQCGNEMPEGTGKFEVSCCSKRLDLAKTMAKYFNI